MSKKTNDSLLVEQIFSDEIPTKSPILASYFNLALPTSGYAYLGVWKKKAVPVLFALGVGGYWLGQIHRRIDGEGEREVAGEIFLGPILLMEGAVFYSMWDAYRLAQEQNELKRKARALEILRNE